MPTFDQCEAKILVDPLHDPYVVIGQGEREWKRNDSDTYQEHDIDPLEVLPLSVTQRFNGSRSEFRSIHELC